MRPEDNENIVFICEDSPEGIYTAVYEAYGLRISHDRITLQIGEEDNLTLFTTYHKMEPDTMKAHKVMRTLRKRFSSKDYYDLNMALAASDKRKAQAVYKTIVWGLSYKGKGSILGSSIRVEHQTGRRVPPLISFSKCS